jgi:hypothetical protein
MELAGHEPATSWVRSKAARYDRGTKRPRFPGNLWRCPKATLVTNTRGYVGDSGTLKPECLNPLRLSQSSGRGAGQRLG